jgi:hypothetical protein
MMPYEELVKLARFCAKEARTSTEKEVRSRAWRLAVQYREDAAKVGEPPDIGDGGARAAFNLARQRVARPAHKMDFRVPAIGGRLL